MKITLDKEILERFKEYAQQTRKVLELLTLIEKKEEKVWDELNKKYKDYNLTESYININKGIFVLPFEDIEIEEKQE